MVTIAEVPVSSKKDLWVHGATGLKDFWLEYIIGQVPENPEKSSSGTVKFLRLSPAQVQQKEKFLREVCRRRCRGWFAFRAYEEVDEGSVNREDLLTNFAIWGESEEEISQLLAEADRLYEEVQRPATLSRYPFYPIAGGAGGLDWKTKALLLAVQGVGVSVKAFTWTADKVGSIKDQIPVSSPRVLNTLDRLRCSKKTAIGITMVAAGLTVATLLKAGGVGLPSPVNVPPERGVSTPAPHLSYRDRSLSLDKVFPDVLVTSTTFPEEDTYYLHNPDVRSGNFSSTKGACEGYDILYSGITEDIRFNPRDGRIAREYALAKEREPLLHENRIAGCRLAVYLANRPQDFNSGHPDLIRHFDPANVVPCGHAPGSANCALNRINIPQINQLFAQMGEKTRRGENFAQEVELPE